MRYKNLFIACCLLTVITVGQAQQDNTTAYFHPSWSIKNNLLYDATLTPNLAIEVMASSRSSLQLFYGIHPWKFSDTKKWRHWSLMPEYRYWLNREKGPFQGWFTGVHALGGEYNVGGTNAPFGLFKTLKHNRYEGWYVGGGLTLGHAWRLGDHWNIEAAVGIGYIRFQYDKYENEICGLLLESGPYNYLGPTKLALNIAYVFGKKVIPPPPPEEPAPIVEPYLPHYRLAYIVPLAEKEKSRHLSGQAYLDFVVNKTDIQPAYRNNNAELRKVEETINVVRCDSNTTITHIDIHGYASPEGSYQNNVRLAEGRAKAFKDYVQQLIDLPASIFSVSSTPEDWEGLLAWIEREPLADHQTEIKAIMSDSLIMPDQKERQLKTRYPAEWKLLLAEVFPALRHSDYRVNYTIRPFTVEEAKALVRTKPQQLSLNELFLVANTYTPGSQDYNDVFETAVRMYPDDETANLNAAVIALEKNDLTAAGRYLQKAGSSPEALNARGVLAVKNSNPKAAEEFFHRAGSLKEAQHNLDELQKYIHSIQ